MVSAADDTCQRASQPFEGGHVEKAKGGAPSRTGVNPETDGCVLRGERISRAKGHLL